MSIMITIPDFAYTAHFYPEILEDLTLYMRQNVPELTDEDPTEPHIQIIRATSLAYHLNSVELDIVANEMFLPTAKLRASHKALLNLIDVDLAQASPASADILAQLSQTFSAARLVVPARSQFATIEGPAALAVEFEVLDDVEIATRTDMVGQVYAYNGSVFTDHTAEAQSVSGDFNPTWGPVADDALYIGHPDVLFSQIDFVIGTPAADINGVWEYYDGNFDQGVPTSVTNLGATLEFDLTSILGAADRTGTVVRVRSAITGAFQDIAVVFGTSNTITTSGADSFLGQSSPSLNVNDYIVGSEWRELSDIDDGTSQLTASGTLNYTLPQSVEQKWSKTIVGDGSLAIDGYWIRFRVISVGTPTTPGITQVLIDQGDQYLLFNATQGRSRTDDPLGSSDGTASQEFEMTNFPVIDDDNIVVTVEESSVDKLYTRVDNFLNSVSTDRHFILEFDDDGGGLITFGDGVNGKIPPAGSNNISAEYRTMDEIDGNVGAGTITVNRSGVAFLANVVNPRGASGFTPREGSTEEDLARLKISGPATLRARGRAVSAPDVETVAKAFVASDGQKPVKRALAIEESFGPKTVECVVVGSGGLQVDASKLSEIEDFFNGTDEVGGVLLLNNELTATNFTGASIDATLTLTGGNVTAVLTALTALLNPLATDDDGTYIWEFGGDVVRAKLIQTVMNTDPRPTNVVFSVPAGDVPLATRELPTVGTITINGEAFVP